MVYTAPWRITSPVPSTVQFNTVTLSVLQLLFRENVLQPVDPLVMHSLQIYFSVKSVLWFDVQLHVILWEGINILVQPEVISGKYL